MTDDCLFETFPLGLVYKKTIHSLAPVLLPCSPHSQKCPDFYRAPLQFGSDTTYENKESEGPLLFSPFLVVVRVIIQLQQGLVGLV